MASRACGRRTNYPADVKAWLISETTTRRKAGESVEAIGRDLGVPWKTLARWCSTKRTRRAGFREVEVVVAPSAVPGTPLVHGPHGLRIEGLDVEGIAELVRRLG
jgi:transposase